MLKKLPLKMLTVQVINVIIPQGQPWTHVPGQAPGNYTDMGLKRFQRIFQFVIFAYP